MAKSVYKPPFVVRKAHGSSIQSSIYDADGNFMAFCPKKEKAKFIVHLMNRRPRKAKPKKKEK